MKILKSKIYIATPALLLATLIGCNSTDTVIETILEKGLDSLISQTNLTIGDVDCAFGGMQISSGLDLNSNGMLDSDEVVESNAVCSVESEIVLDPALVELGKDIFRFDTFGDEQKWTDELRIHEVIETSVSPLTALAVGLKVDSEALPEGLLDTVDLSDPATTVALIGLNAVVGIQGTVENIDGVDRLTSIGVTCALCHSDVDNSVLDGIGKRLDGHPNKDIDPGFILSLSPALQDPDVQSVLTSWGPGKFDAFWNRDGINDPTVIPPAYGLNGVHNSTYTSEGDISYWNAYVAVTQMGGIGNFTDEEIGINIEVEDDQVTSKLPALKHYQLSLRAPSPPIGSFDSVSAGKGKLVFENEGQCASCHAGTKFTDSNFTLHTPEEVGTDALLATRSKSGEYRTTPLAGIWQRAPFFHNGSAASLEDVVTHYDNHFGLNLTEEQTLDLVEYLKSL